MLITLSSPYSVTETVDKLTELLKTHGILLFAVIDHAKAAEKIGLHLQEEVLLIFGSPAMGTLLMQEKPTIGVDLPLKLLIWQDVNQLTQMTYFDPAELGIIHGIKQHHEVLEKMRDLLANIINQIT